MNAYLEHIQQLLNQSNITDAERQALLNALADAEKQWAITDFKLDRTEKVKRTTAILLEETIEELEQKRKAVEAQNKELEIETALERVRTVAMSMTASADVLNICRAMFHELLLLNFANLRNVIIHTYNDAKRNFNDYDYSDFTQGHISLIPYSGNPILEKFIQDIRKTTDAFTEIKITGDALKEWQVFRDANNEAPDERLKKIETLYYYIYSVGDAAIGISTFTAVPAIQLDILKRFRNVFDLAYKRFTDISKAEAQAKEAQVQLALERVRARSLAMHHTNELVEIVAAVFEQLKNLGFNVDGSAIVINLFDEDSDGITQWIVDETNHFPYSFHHPYFDNPVLNDIKQARKNGWDYFSAVYNREVKDSFWNYYFEHTDFKRFPDALKQEILAKENYAQSMALEKHSGLLNPNINGQVLNAEQQIILQRFAKVFEQSYIRFLDLQKAEAQAREAQIEAALERIRSRSIAMHKSDELKEVIRLVLDQFVYLNINVAHAGFYIDYKVHDDMHIWLADPNIEPFYATIPYFDTPTWRSFTAAKQTGQNFYTDLLNFDEKNKFYHSLFELFTIPEEAKQFYLECKGLAVSTVLLDSVGLYIENFSAIPYTDEENKILMRVGMVFQQTYTRFLDLQKAEAQAREAQVQLALERVRARTMGMQKSSELAEAAVLLFQQVRLLGIETYASGFTIWENNEQDLISWMCNADGSINPPFKMPATGIEWHRQQYQSWKNREVYIVHDFSGAAMQEYYTYLKSFPLLAEAFKKSEASGVKTPERQVHNVFNFMHGNLLFITLQPVPEAYTIFERFAKTFDQTYTRFLDLQKAEAQAREAQIQLALERVRARTMAMQQSHEIADATLVLFQQFTELRTLPTQVSICIFDEAIENGDMYVTLNGEKIDRSYAMEMNKEGFVMKKVKAAFLEKKKELSIAITGKELQDYNRWRNNFVGAKRWDDSDAVQQQSWYVECVFFSRGIIAVSSDAVLSADTVSLLKRFVKVFDETFTRFLDLQKAEAQAREAQIEAALERVRSRTLAMQHSNELAETASELFRQMITLGIEPNRLYIAVIHKENDEADFWITDEDGGKLSVAYTANLNDNPTFKKMYDGWKQQLQHLIIDMRGNELQNYFRYLQGIHVPFKGGLEQKRRVQHLAYFSKGFIGMASPDEQPAETLQLLERFAYVFNLTFTRFNDLQIAEAHAVQAELDLIAIKEAKQKAEEALTELQATQKQLIQSEKMASLGELTAGIAHEIQNPLNFVNNFSEVSNELIDEMNEELNKGDIEEAKAISNDIKQNLEKINHHGKRADAIVKGMLQHSRSSSATKEPTDINKLADEYLRLAYHGLRAKDKSFNATLKTDFDESIGNINIIPQDMGRVILNLITNAFYAVTEKNVLGLKDLTHLTAYEPTVSVSTKKTGDKVAISVQDNGNGIPENIIHKIFQPFFTTKPTGQGTGLGLSLSYDIVKAHGGDIKVETKEGAGTTFIIQIPAN